MKPIIILITVQLVGWFIGWRMWESKPSKPEDMLKGVGVCFIMWWVVIPVFTVLALNDHVTEYVKRRRDVASESAKSLRSGQDSGLYQ